MKQLLALFVLFAWICPTVFGQQGNASLLAAIKDLNVDRVRAALDSGASPSTLDAKTSAAESVLNQVMFAYFEIDENEMKLNEAPEALDDKAYQILRLLFEKGARISEVTSLYVPVSFNCKKATEYLLSLGADPNMKTGDYGSLMTTAVKYQHIELVGMLLRYGAKALPDSDASQLIFTQVCCDGNFREVVKRVNAGAPINKLDLEGQSALMQACYGNIAGIAEFLLLKGADPNISNINDCFRYPIVRAAYNASKRFGDEVGWIRVVKIMLDKGGFVSVSDTVGKTALHWVCLSRVQSVILAETLLKAGIKVMQKDKDGKTALDYAVSGEMIKLLKSYGAKE